MCGQYLKLPLFYVIFMRVTLSLDETNIELIKNYARETGRSFSGLIKIATLEMIKKEKRVIL